MTPEIAGYLEQSDWLLGQFAAGLRDAPEHALHYSPPAHMEANTLLAIAQHAAAVTRVYSLGFGCGQPVDRDCSAEFDASSLTRESPLETLAALRADLAAGFAALDLTRLDTPFTPPQHVYGLGEPREMTPRQALIESVRHLAIHLGEFRLTRSLAHSA